MRWGDRLKPVEFDVLVAFMMVVGLDSTGKLPKQPPNKNNPRVARLETDFLFK